MTVNLKQKLTLWNRKRICAAVVRNGQALDRLYVLRAGLDRDVWPGDADAVDEAIEQRERRREALLDKLRTQEV